MKKLPAPTEGTELKMDLLVSEKHMTNKLERATTSNIKRTYEWNKLNLKENKFKKRPLASASSSKLQRMPSLSVRLIR